MIREFFILHITGFITGVILDLIIGDPHFMPHPVRAIGSFILFLEKRLLPSVKNAAIRDPEKERKDGMLLWIIVTLSVSAVSFMTVSAAYMLHKYLGFAAEAVLTCYIMSAGSLCRESMKVYRKLKENDIEAARSAVSMIVGRDTGGLDEEGVIKAAVETVAENTCDGVTAPLIFTAIGGPVLGMLYKAVNTMDSMLGYRNEKYENFGFFAAKADDFFNYIPARLSALAMIHGSFVLGIFNKGFSGRGAYRIWKRDRKNHSSPNSAQTESVCAGALGLKLGGTHLYGGVPVEKPYIGDEARKAEAADIIRADMLMFTAEAITAASLLLLYIILYCYDCLWLLG